MKIGLRLCVLLGCLAFPALAEQAPWQAVEKVEPYLVAGTSGGALYASIGARGPKVGGDVRAIAHTNFKLTWTRKYQASGNACSITTARPKLIITYTLPKPAERLPAAVAKRWTSFIDGVYAHERVHGDMIKDMVRKIESTSLGLTVADDPDCRKIRVELTRRLGELSQAQRAQSRDFDRVELASGGNIQQLVLALVNGQ
ncbi:MAG: DUF922 domain-containing Zn-dependent protease [Allorhizobium sp.]